MAGMCQDTSHYCTNCGKKVAHKPHDGQMQPILQMESQMVASSLPLAENSASQNQTVMSQAQGMQTQQPAQVAQMHVPQKAA